MKALLLAAGYGSRLGELTRQTPKCLMQVGGKTMLDHWLFKLNALGVEDFIINTHYLPEKVINFIANHELKEKITLSFEKELLGTAGTLAAHSEILSTEVTFIVHVDNFCFSNLEFFVEAHNNRPSDAIFTMLTFTTPNPENCGIVEVNEKNILINFHEKTPSAPSCRANGAVYISSPEFFNFIKKFDLFQKDISKHLIPMLFGKIYCVHTIEYFVDIGSKQSLNEANKLATS